MLKTLKTKHQNKSSIKLLPLFKIQIGAFQNQ